MPNRALHLRIKRKTIFEGYLLLIIAQQECGLRFLKYRSELDRFFICSNNSFLLSLIRP